MGAKHSKGHHDMAICFVVFNPAQTKRMLMNYFFCRNEFMKQGLPVFTMELVYEGREPEIPDAFHVHASSVMFHKENLYRLLEKRIPKKYTKLAFLDCDVVFEDPSWYKDTSDLLNDHEIVQPFENAHWMDLTYTTAYLTRQTVVLNKSKQWSFEYHPGFAWCMTRKWYKKVGFFDYAISGSGDTLSSAAWLKKVFPKNFQSLPKPLVSVYSEFSAHEKPGVAYLKGMNLYHLYHGSRKNRQYSERHALLNSTKTPITDLIKPNKEGVFEWVVDSESWNQKFQAYFEFRNDDDISEESVTVKVSPYG